MSTDRFTLWFAEVKGDQPTQIRPPKTYLEPAEAADAAENYLKYYGSSSEGSLVEIRFNGDKEPHTIIFLMDGTDPPTFGIWNTPSAMWPIFYPESSYGIMLDGNPLDGDDDGKGKHKKDDDSDKMKLDGMDDGDDENDDDENEGDDEESEEGEDESEESDDSDNDEDENENSDEGEEETDDDGVDDDEGENETDQEEIEMPRLKIFGKMRGPKGWRKRAEAEELLERNVFGLKIGVLDPEAEKPGRQERNVLALVEFVESDTTRDHGILKLRLPDDVTLDDFTQSKAGVITVKIPYGDES